MVIRGTTFRLTHDAYIPKHVQLSNTKHAKSARSVFALLGIASAILFATALVQCGGDDNKGNADGSVDGTIDDDGGNNNNDGATTDASDDGSIPFCDGGPMCMCLNLGSACKTNSDCCSATCNGGVCSFPKCTSDNQACMTNGECCSKICNAGKCQPLNNSCKTLGNACMGNGECCSALCKGGVCSPSSFCGQGGDVCATNTDCCTGICNKPMNQLLGTCSSTPPGGAANCGLVDGLLCTGQNVDGGVILVDGGLPACGGPCCSRNCSPYGPTDVMICQPASGCHVVGDLCTADKDCCGSSGLPGGSGKPVTCDKSGGYAVGICRLPMGCKPNGDVCKLKTMTCNSSCDCCIGNCEVKDTCHQDILGVPRCSFPCDGGAPQPNQACATSADCCGYPCVPNPNYKPDSGISPLTARRRSARPAATGAPSPPTAAPGLDASSRTEARAARAVRATTAACRCPMAAAINMGSCAIPARIAATVSRARTVGANIRRPIELGEPLAHADTDVRAQTVFEIKRPPRGHLVTW